MDIIQDIMAAIAVILNVLPPAMLGLTYGLAAFPTAVACFVGAAGMMLFGQVVPITY